MTVSTEGGAPAFARQLPPDIDALGRLTEEIEEFVAGARVPARDAQRITLSVDELLTNIVQYGTAPGVDPEIRIRVEVRPSEVRIDIEHRGMRFDPFQDTTAPDINLPLHARPIGGLGVFFVKTLMTSVDYEYSGGRNRVTLTRLLDQTDQEVVP